MKTHGSPPGPLQSEQSGKPKPAKEPASIDWRNKEVRGKIIHSGLIAGSLGLYDCGDLSRIGIIGRAAPSPDQAAA